MEVCQIFTPPSPPPPPDQMSSFEEDHPIVPSRGREIFNSSFFLHSTFLLSLGGLGLFPSKDVDQVSGWRFVRSNSTDHHTFFLIRHYFPLKLHAHALFSKQETSGLGLSLPAGSVHSPPDKIVFCDRRAMPTCFFLPPSSPFFSHSHGVDPRCFLISMTGCSCPHKS